MSLHKRIRDDVISGLSSIKGNEIPQMNNGFRLLCKWRSLLIQNTFLQNEGKKVIGGLFKGMDFIEQSSEGCHVAKLLGCYEQPLFEHIEKIIKQDQYDYFINVGCAEGYYAIGMALRMPRIKVLAYDTDENTQTTCKQLAEKNKVSERIEISGTFTHETLKQFTDSKTLLMCDIEGAEQELLDPELAPELKSLDIIVEAHECLRPGILRLLIERFEESHEIITVHDNGSRVLNEAPDWFNDFSHLDQLLALWEWRSGPTPWLVMMKKS
jgi:hypothetical protein